MTNKNKTVLKEVTSLAVGEVIVSALVILGFFLLSLFTEITLDYKVFLGVLLGSIVTVLNYLFLSISVNRAIDKFLANGRKHRVCHYEVDRVGHGSVVLGNKGVVE